MDPPQTSATDGAAHNNWVLLAGVAVASLGGALVYGVFGVASLAIPLYFLVASASLAFLAFLWLRRHPPALLAPRWSYVVVVAGLELGAFFGGALEDTRAVGAWLAVGAAFAVYGLLERSGIIVATGACAALAALVAFVLAIPALGVSLELATASIFAVGTFALRGQRPRGR